MSLINQELKMVEIKEIKEYLNKGYTLYIGITKNDRVALLVGKDNVFLPYDAVQGRFILTGVKKVQK